jgi:hypothetical protein
MSSARRRTSARHSVSRTQIVNGASPIRLPSGIESARDLLSQALEDVETVAGHFHDKHASAYSQTAALNAMASGSAYVPDLDDDLLGTNITIKSEPDDYSDADSPLPKQKRFRFRASRRARKRKIVEDPPSPPPAPSPYTVKLFDRTVDLNSYDQRTPLYVLCRAWVRNPQSGSSVLDDLDDRHELRTAHTQHDESEEALVHELPAPSSVEHDVRIPTSVQKPEATAQQIDDAINSQSSLSLHELLSHNRGRWKSVRQDWLRSAAQNETRYKPSLDLLKSMYER